MMEMPVGLYRIIQPWYKSQRENPRPTTLFAYEQHKECSHYGFSVVQLEWLEWLNHTLFCDGQKCATGGSMIYHKYNGKQKVF